MRQLLLLFLVSALLGAHEYWIDGTGVLQRGHPGTNTPEHGDGEAAFKQYPAERFCRRGGKIEEKQGDFGVSGRLETGCDTVMVVLQLGRYAKTPYGILPLNEADPSMTLNSWESVESVKRLNRPGDYAPLGRGFELSLSRDPSGLEVGDKLRVLATFDGVPKAGVAVACDGRVVGTTDEEGHINVRVRRTGLQVLRATYRQPLVDVPVRERLYNATLNLEVQ